MDEQRTHYIRQLVFISVQQLSYWTSDILSTIKYNSYLLLIELVSSQTSVNANMLKMWRASLYVDFITLLTFTCTMEGFLLSLSLSLGLYLYSALPFFPLYFLYLSVQQHLSVILSLNVENVLCLFNLYLSHIVHQFPSVSSSVRCCV